ncbi:MULTISPECIES: hypothetical protein [unclassified Streptomyces]|uniref:hypothetical protein n=1 Tax=unclassified Streptomyces TaxID=2593676 RepID=UPI0037F87811
MAINSEARRSGSSVSARKSPINRKWIGLATLALTPLVVLASPGVASAASNVCLQNPENSPHDMAGNWSTDDKTTAVGTQQAGNTWQDWVWRGDTFKCPTNVPSCSYAWQKSQTTGWQWSAGLSIKVPNFFGSDLGSLTPSYGRNGSTTTSFTFTVNLKPGQSAQPIQVVERRWTQGVYKGIYKANGKTCLVSPSNPNGKAFRYDWYPNEQWGSWTTNLRVNDWGTYNVQG